MHPFAFVQRLPVYPAVCQPSFSTLRDKYVTRRKSRQQYLLPRCVIEQFNKLNIDADLQNPATRGSFGDIFFGKLRPSNEPVVLKRARDSKTAQTLFAVERKINRRLEKIQEEARDNETDSESTPRRWPQYLGDYIRDSQSFLVWRKEGDGSTLGDYLSTKPIPMLCAALNVPHSMHQPLQFSLFTCVVRGLLLAVREIHSRGIVHRDVKPGNVLVVPSTGRMLLYEDQDDRIRLIDFGSSCDVRGLLWSRGVNTLDPLYAAPELRLNLIAPMKFDVFSVAMIGLAVLMPSYASEARLRELRNALEAEDFDLERFRQQWLSTRDPAIAGNGIGAEVELAALFNEKTLRARQVFYLLFNMLRKSPLKRCSVDDALEGVMSLSP